MLTISDFYLDKPKSFIPKKILKYHVPWIALFLANRWRLDVLTFRIKGFDLPDLSKRGTKLSPGPESVGSCFHDFFPRNYHFVVFFCARESSHNGLISFFKENYNSLPQV